MVNLNAEALSAEVKEIIQAIAKHEASEPPTDDPGWQSWWNTRTYLLEWLAFKNGWLVRAGGEFISYVPAVLHGDQSDRQDIFEAMEQFKREHPEYDQAKDTWKITREAMEAYQRYLDSQKANCTFTTASSTEMKWQTCSMCVGAGITIAGYKEFSCPICCGAGGWFI